MLGPASLNGCTNLNTVGWGAVCILAFAAIGFAEEPGAPVAASDSSAAFVALTVEPAEIVLHAANRRQQLLVTGRRAGDWVEIREGIVPDARLVASGGAFLKDGDIVSVTPKI